MRWIASLKAPVYSPPEIRPPKTVDGAAERGDGRIANRPRQASEDAEAAAVAGRPVGFVNSIPLQIRGIEEARRVCEL